MNPIKPVTPVKGVDPVKNGLRLVSPRYVPQFGSLSKAPMTLLDPLLNDELRQRARFDNEQNVFNEVAGRAVGTAEGAGAGYMMGTIIGSIVGTIVALSSGGTLTSAIPFAASLGGKIGASVGAVAGAYVSDYSTWYVTERYVQKTLIDSFSKDPLTGILTSLASVGETMDQAGGGKIIKSALKSLITGEDVAKVIAQSYGIGDSGRVEMDFSDIREALGVDIGTVGNFVMDMLGEFVTDPGAIAGIPGPMFTYKGANKAGMDAIEVVQKSTKILSEDLSGKLSKEVAVAIRKGDRDRVLKLLGNRIKDNEALDTFINAVEKEAYKRTSYVLSKGFREIDKADDALTGLLFKGSYGPVGAWFGSKAILRQTSEKMTTILGDANPIVRKFIKANEFIFGNDAKYNIMRRTTNTAYDAAKTFIYNRESTRSTGTFLNYTHNAILTDSAKYIVKKYNLKSISELDYLPIDEVDLKAVEELKKSYSDFKDSVRVKAKAELDAKKKDLIDTSNRLQKSRRGGDIESQKSINDEFQKIYKEYIVLWKEYEYIDAPAAVNEAVNLINKIRKTLEGINSLKDNPNLDSLLTKQMKLLFNIIKDDSSGKVLKYLDGLGVRPFIDLIQTKMLDETDKILKEIYEVPASALKALMDKYSHAYHINLLRANLESLEKVPPELKPYEQMIKDGSFTEEQYIEIRNAFLSWADKNKMSYDFGLGQGPTAEGTGTVLLEKGIYSEVLKLEQALARLDRLSHKLLNSDTKYTGFIERHNVSQDISFKFRMQFKDSYKNVINLLEESEKAGLISRDEMKRLTSTINLTMSTHSRVSQSVARLQRMVVTMKNWLKPMDGVEFKYRNYLADQYGYPIPDPDVDADTMVNGVKPTIIALKPMKDWDLNDVFTVEYIDDILTHRTKYNASNGLIEGLQELKDSGRITNSTKLSYKERKYGPAFVQFLNPKIKGYVPDGVTSVDELLEFFQKEYDLLSNEPFSVMTFKKEFKRLLKLTQDRLSDSTMYMSQGMAERTRLLVADIEKTMNDIMNMNDIDFRISKKQYLSDIKKDIFKKLNELQVQQTAIAIASINESNQFLLDISLAHLDKIYGNISVGYTSLFNAIKDEAELLGSEANASLRYLSSFSTVDGLKGIDTDFLIEHLRKSGLADRPNRDVSKFISNLNKLKVVLRLREVGAMNTKSFGEILQLASGGQKLNLTKTIDGLLTFENIETGVTIDEVLWSFIRTELLDPDKAKSLYRFAETNSFNNMDDAAVDLFQLLSKTVPQIQSLIELAIGESNDLLFMYIRLEDLLQEMLDSVSKTIYDSIGQNPEALYLILKDKITEINSLVQIKSNIDLLNRIGVPWQSMVDTTKLTFKKGSGVIDDSPYNSSAIIDIINVLNNRGIYSVSQVTEILGVSGKEKPLPSPFVKDFISEIIDEQFSEDLTAKLKSSSKVFLHERSVTTPNGAIDDLPLEDFSIIVLDTETTGNLSNGLLSLAYIELAYDGNSWKVVNRNKLFLDHQYVNKYGWKIDESVDRLNKGQTVTNLKGHNLKGNAHSLEDMMNQLDQVLKQGNPNKIVVAHNASFDMQQIFNTKAFLESNGKTKLLIDGDTLTDAKAGKLAIPPEIAAGEAGLYAKYFDYNVLDSLELVRQFQIFPSMFGNSNSTLGALSETIDNYEVLVNELGEPITKYFNGKLVDISFEPPLNKAVLKKVIHGVPGSSDDAIETVFRKANETEFVDLHEADVDIDITSPWLIEAFNKIKTEGKVNSIRGLKGLEYIEEEEINRLLDGVDTNYYQVYKDKLDGIIRFIEDNVNTDPGKRPIPVNENEFRYALEELKELQLKLDEARGVYRFQVLVEIEDYLVSLYKKETDPLSKFRKSQSDIIGTKKVVEPIDESPELKEIFDLAKKSKEDYKNRTLQGKMKVEFDATERVLYRRYMQPFLDSALKKAKKLNYSTAQMRVIFGYFKMHPDDLLSPATQDIFDLLDDYTISFGDVISQRVRHKEEIMALLGYKNVVYRTTNRNMVQMKLINSYRNNLSLRAFNEAMRGELSSEVANDGRAGPIAQLLLDIFNDNPALREDPTFLEIRDMFDQLDESFEWYEMALKKIGSNKMPQIDTINRTMDDVWKEINNYKKTHGNDLSSAQIEELLNIISWTVTNTLTNSKGAHVNNEWTIWFQDSVMEFISNKLKKGQDIFLMPDSAFTNRLYNKIMHNFINVLKDDNLHRIINQQTKSVIDVRYDHTITDMESLLKEGLNPIREILSETKANNMKYSLNPIPYSYVAKDLWGEAKLADGRIYKETIPMSDLPARNSSVVLRRGEHLKEGGRLKSLMYDILGDWLIRTTQTNEFRSIPTLGFEETRLGSIFTLLARIRKVDVSKLMNDLKYSGIRSDATKSSLYKGLYEDIIKQGLDYEDNLAVSIIGAIETLNAETLPYIKPEHIEDLKNLLRAAFIETIYNPTRYSFDESTFYRALNKDTATPYVTYKNAMEVINNTKVGWDTLKKFFINPDGSKNVVGLMNYFKNNPDQRLIYLDPTDGKLKQLKVSSPSLMGDVLSNNDDNITVLDLDTYKKFTQQYQRFDFDDNTLFGKYVNGVRDYILQPLKMFSLAFSLPFVISNVFAAMIQNTVSLEGTANVGKVIKKIYSTGKDYRVWKKAFLDTSTNIFFSKYVSQFGMQELSWYDQINNKNLILFLEDIKRHPENYDLQKIENASEKLEELLSVVRTIQDDVQMNATLKDIDMYMQTAASSGLSADIMVQRNIAENYERNAKYLEEHGDVDEIFITRNMPSEKMDILGDTTHEKFSSFEQEAQYLEKSLKDKVIPPNKRGLARRRLNAVKRYIRVQNASKTNMLTNFGLFKGRLGVSPDTNLLSPRGFLEVNGDIESVFRIGMMRGLMEEGSTLSEASYEVIRRHFLYTDKSLGEKLGELVIPFLSYPTRAMNLFSELTQDASFVKLAYFYDKYFWGSAEEQAQNSDYLRNRKTRGDIPIGDKLVGIGNPFTEAMQTMSAPGYSFNNKMNPLFKPVADLITKQPADRVRWNQLPIISQGSNAYESVSTGTIASVTNSFYRYQNYFYNKSPQVQKAKPFYNKLYTTGGYSRVAMRMELTDIKNVQYRVSDILYERRIKP